MLRKVVRLAGVVAAGALAAWWGRAVAHSKKPAPEGRWREIPASELEGRE